jgi:hypothetical protein
MTPFQKIVAGRRKLFQMHKINKQNDHRMSNIKVTADRGRFRVFNDAKLEVLNSGYSEIAIQEAMDSMKNLRHKKGFQDNISLQGKFNSISSPLQIESYTHIRLRGRISLANAANCNMFESKTPESYTRNITIEGGVLEGNRTNQSAESNGIKIAGSTAPPDQNGFNIIKNMLIKSFRDSGVYLYSNASFSPCFLSYGIFSWYNYGTATSAGMKIEGIVDSFFHHSNYEGIYPLYIALASSATPNANLIFDTIYLAGAADPKNNLYAGYLRYSTLANFFIDATDNNPVLLDGVRQSTFTGINIRKGAQGNDGARDAIKLQTASINPTQWKCIKNVFTGVNFILYSPVSHKFAYGINESNTDCDENTFSGIYGASSICNSGAVNLQGTNSKADTGDIIGTIV